MYKTALAALSLALSFGLSVAVSAQDSNQNTTGQGQGNNQDSSQNSSGTTNSTNSTNSNSTKPATTTTAATPAKPAAPAPAPVYVQTYGKNSTPVPTKTASIGKTSTTTTTTTGATPAATVAKKSKDETALIQESPPKKYLSAKNKQWQTFDAYINLKPGQESMPLTMTVTNENYTGINMLLNGQKLATDKDFKGTALRMQMTGALAGGDNKLTVQAFGPVGANLSWKLTTLKPVITSIKPAAGSTEDDITLTGRNFSKTASGNVVYVDKKACIIKSAGSSGKEIIFNLPKDAQSGKVQITVGVGGIFSKGIEFSVKFAPEVTGVDLISAPPGQTMTISGKGFSTTQSENVVTIGGVPAPITSCSSKSITITIPEMFYPQWHLPISVKTGGVESKPGVQINIQSRVIPNDGVPEQ